MDRKRSLIFGMFATIMSIGLTGCVEEETCPNIRPDLQELFETKLYESQTIGVEELRKYESFTHICFVAAEWSPRFTAEYALGLGSGHFGPTFGRDAYCKGRHAIALISGNELTTIWLHKRIFEVDQLSCSEAEGAKIAVVSSLDRSNNRRLRVRLLRPGKGEKDTGIEGGSITDHEAPLRR